MEIKIIKNSFSDLKIKNYKLVCFDDIDDENIAVSEIFGQISTAKLSIQVEFPVMWKRAEKKLDSLGFNHGLYTVLYNSENCVEEATKFHIENLRKIDDLNWIMYIQQKFHYDLDVKYFETPEKLDFAGYIKYMLANQKFFCVYEKDKLKAFAALESDDGFYIAELIVAEEFRGRGAGKALLLEVINYVKTNGNPKLWTTLSARNLNALEFYTRCGFMQTKQRWYKA